MKDKSALDVKGAQKKNSERINTLNTYTCNCERIINFLKMVGRDFKGGNSLLQLILQEGPVVNNKNNK